MKLILQKFHVIVIINFSEIILFVTLNANVSRIRHLKLFLLKLTKLDVD